MSGLRWVFDPTLPSGAQEGGLVDAHVIDPKLDNFVREVLQNSRDRRVGDQPVRVRFTLVELEKAALTAFLEGINWTELEPHIKAAADNGGVTIGPQITRALDEIHSGRLRILRVEDSFTEGLTGAEDDNLSNFNMLTRHKLVTSERDNVRGGSFGLGKSVLWRFSMLSTVLFSSRISGNPREGFRFFGRAELPHHDCYGASWHGSGWLGLEAERSNGRRAESAWDAEAEAAATQTHLSRVPGPTGTSILVIGFFEPQREEPRSLVDIAEEMRAASMRGFWPSLEGPTPALHVRVDVEGLQVPYAMPAEPTEEVQPFIRARRTEEVQGSLEDVGDVISEEIDLVLPEERSGAPKITAQATLRLRLAGTADSPELRNTIALVRGAGAVAGAGMVIRYKPTTVPVEAAFHGVLLTGLAHGDSGLDERAERFLRAAERPAHDDWISSTDRMRAGYRNGGASLRSLFDRVDEAVRRAFAIANASNSEGPRRLMELFPLTGRGGGQTAPQRFRVSRLHGERTATSWLFSGRVHYLAEKSSPWRFTVVAKVDAESGPGDALELLALETSAGNTAVMGTEAVCSVSADDPREVSFNVSLTVPQDPSLPPADQLSMSLNVTPALGS